MLVSPRETGVESRHSSKDARRYICQ
uniref:Uncharacterized protein n=1 Tax=Anopheles minimus TaxID=112268 RepID=A0A182WPD4_9DIPT